jgi:hypothetical protein
MDWAGHLDVDRSRSESDSMWLVVMIDFDVAFGAVLHKFIQVPCRKHQHFNHATTKWSYSLTKWGEGILNPTKATVRRITHIKLPLLQNEDILTVHHSTWANSRDEVRVAISSAAARVHGHINSQLNSGLNSTRL